MTAVTFPDTMLLMFKKMPSNQEAGLLRSFIIDKASHYSEPQKKGTPRGEAIGLSQKKYWASLLLLTTIPLKEVSNNLSVSYGLLRKWRTESDFKKQVEKNSAEFVSLFMENFLKKANEQEDAFEKYCKFGNYAPPEFAELISDLDFYGLFLRKRLFNELQKIHHSDKGRVGFLAFWLAYFFAINLQTLKPAERRNLKAAELGAFKTLRVNFLKFDNRS